MSRDKERRGSNFSDSTFISLMQVDPSPIDTPEDLEKGLPELPDYASTTRSSTFSTLGLSGSGRGAVYYLTRIQKYSSYAFGAFGAMHITNTSLIPLITRSVPASETYLLLTRPYYQSPLLEPLLIALPLTTHIASGMLLRLYRHNLALQRYTSHHPNPSLLTSLSPKTWPPLSTSSLTGYLLIPLLSAHVYINRALPLYYEGGSSSVGLGYVAHGFARFPKVAWGLYAGLVGAGVGHIVWGVAKYMAWTPAFAKTDRSARRRWRGINAVALLATAVWMAGGLGVIGAGGADESWIGRGYDALYSKVPLLN